MSEYYDIMINAIWHYTAYTAEVLFLTVRPPLRAAQRREGRRIKRNNRGIDRGSVLLIGTLSPRDKWCNPVVCSDISATHCLALQ